jgi:hypothetical protein
MSYRRFKERCLCNGFAFQTHRLASFNKINS